VISPGPNRSSSPLGAGPRLARYRAMGAARIASALDLGFASVISLPQHSGASTRGQVGEFIQPCSHRLSETLTPTVNTHVPPANTSYRLKGLAAGKRIFGCFNVDNVAETQTSACAIRRKRTYPREIGPIGFADLTSDGPLGARMPQPIIAEISPTDGII
jgi:hypothetical protein